MPTFNIDGQSTPAAEANISVLDHGLLYGDGVFEGLRFYASRIFRCSEHLVRLKNSATAIGLVLPMSEQEMADAMNEAIDRSGQADGYIRLVVTRGTGPLGIDSSTCRNPKTIVIVDELALVPEETVKQGAKVIIASTRRLSPDQVDPRVKSLNYLNNIMARNEANAAGADEAILLNDRGRIAEGSGDNVFVVQQGELKTPPTTEGALEGITRGAIIELAQACNIPVSESPLTPFDLATADECFLTGTGAELIPVKYVGQTQLNDERPVFDKLQSEFRQMVSGQS